MNSICTGLPKERERKTKKFHSRQNRKRAKCENLTSRNTEKTTSKVLLRNKSNLEPSSRTLKQDIQPYERENSTMRAMKKTLWISIEILRNRQTVSLSSSLVFDEISPPFLARHCQRCVIRREERGTQSRAEVLRPRTNHINRRTKSPLKMAFLHNK